jgi:hypothetical protein
MNYSGSISIDSWTLHFNCNKSGDAPWSLELRTPYGELITRETRSASPMHLLDALVDEAISSLRTRQPTRAPKPPLKIGRKVLVATVSESRLGPRKAPTKTLVTKGTTLGGSEATK